MTSCDHVIKESHNLILGLVSPRVSTLQRLVTIRSGEREILFLVCHVTSVWVTFDFFGAFTYKQLHFEKIAQLFSRTNFPTQGELLV